MHIISSFYSHRLERIETIISGSATGMPVATATMLDGVKRYIDSIHPEQDRRINGKDTLSIRPFNLDTLEEQAIHQAAREFRQKGF